MAMYQLCRAKAAKHPFYIESIDINIYTMKNCVTGWKESWACKGWRSIFVRN